MMTPNIYGHCIKKIHWGIGGTPVNIFPLAAIGTVGAWCSPRHYCPSPGVGSGGLWSLDPGCYLFTLKGPRAPNPPRALLKHP
jgi:hypothetical protein